MCAELWRRKDSMLEVTRRADIVLSSRVFALQKGGRGWVRPDASLIFVEFGQIIEDSMGFSTLV